MFFSSFCQILQSGETTKKCNQSTIPVVLFFFAVILGRTRSVLGLSTGSEFFVAIKYKMGSLIINIVIMVVLFGWVVCGVVPANRFKCDMVVFNLKLATLNVCRGSSEVTRSIVENMLNDLSLHILCLQEISPMELKITN